MKLPIEIRMDGWTLDGRYQRLFFAYLDLSDFLGLERVLVFVIGRNMLIKNFVVDTRTMKEGSSKRAFGEWMVEMCQKSWSISSN